MTKSKNQLADDMLYGINQISKFLGMPVRRTYYLAEQRCIPVFKIGALWAARKSTISEWIATAENEARK